MLLLTPRPGCGGSFFPHLALAGPQKTFYVEIFSSSVWQTEVWGPGIIHQGTGPAPLGYPSLLWSTGWGGVEHGGSRGRGMPLPRLYM